LFELFNSDETPFEEEWEQRVLEDHIFFSEYGLPFDPRTLPAKEYHAHLAIIRGKNMKQQEESEKTEREAKKAKRQT